MKLFKVEGGFEWGPYFDIIVIAENEQEALQLAVARYTEGWEHEYQTKIREYERRAIIWNRRNVKKPEPVIREAVEALFKRADIKLLTDRTDTPFCSEVFFND